MADRPTTWPKAVDELLPNTLFRLAAQYPDLTYSEYPCNATRASEGYRKITYHEFANAVHAVARWIEQNVGKPKRDDGSETIVYMGPNDLRYIILVLGSVMVGYKMLFPTPRSGAKAIITLIERANGTIMLIPSNLPPVVSEVLQKCPLRTFDFPSMEHFLSSSTSPYPYTKTFESSKNEPLVCLYTSGTTGFPKPIIWTHAWVNSITAGHYLPAPLGYERIDEIFLGPQVRLMATFPLFHASGISGALFFPLYRGTTIVYAPVAETSNATVEAVADALDVLDEEGKIDVLAMPPHHMEYLGANVTLLNKVNSKVATAWWGGGDLSNAAGSAIATKMYLFNYMASTELGLWLGLRSFGAKNEERKFEGDWHYLMFHPALNIRFDAMFENAEGTVYQAILVKNKGENAWVQAMFKIYTEVEEISLGDLFTQHPKNPRLWRHYGRADDMLNFLTTETFHPGPAEQRIAAHPGVAEVLMVGTRRPKASLIVRLEVVANLDCIWQLVENVNKDSPMCAQVERHMILTVTEPFLRTAKGTVQKKAVVDLYGKELDALYEKDGSFVPAQ